MKKYNLKIKNNKTQLNEVEIGIDQIAKATGVGETASVLNQLVKTATATVKLALGVLFSFRSLNIQKITANIDQANKTYSKRVRNAMRELDKTNQTLEQNSMAAKAFAYTVPAAAITDYLRKEVDNAGGLYNYLSDESSQNLLVGDAFSSIYNVYDSALKKSMGLGKGKSTNSKEEEQSRKISKIDMIRIKFRKEFGQDAVKVLDDVLNDRDTVGARSLIKIVSDKDLKGEKRQKAIYDFFNAYRKQKLESFIKRTSLLISEKKTGKVKYSNESKLNVIVSIAEALNLQEKINKDILSNVSNEEGNVKEDIEKISTFLMILVCDYTVYASCNNFINSNDIQEQKVANEIKLSNVKMSDEARSEINKFSTDLFKNLNGKNKKDCAIFLIAALDNIRQKNVYENQKISDYIENLNRYSNSDNGDFTKLKEGINKFYEKNSNINIDSTIDKVKESLDKEDENNKTT